MDKVHKPAHAQDFQQCQMLLEALSVRDGFKTLWDWRGSHRFVKILRALSCKDFCEKFFCEMMYSLVTVNLASEFVQTLFKFVRNV